MANNNLIEDFVSAIKTEKPKQTTTHSAQVSKIDKEGTVWVRVAGSTKETPTAMNASEVKKGDSVNVEWRNNKLYIAGNYSDPSAGSARVAAVEDSAARANDAAIRAVNDAGIAKAAADQAVADAETAREAAESADDAAQSATQSAERAGLAAEQASIDAQEASDSAKSATASASTALGQLSQIEDVMRVIDWAARHGTYGLTADTEPVAGKWYFELVDGAYSVVTLSETDDPHALGLYELTGVDEAISNYISTHLALTDSGLYVQMDDNAARLQITSTGIILWGADGKPIAQYTSDVILGDEGSTHIKLTSGELGFYKDKNTKVAYISGNKLYIAESEVTNTQRIGAFVWTKQSDNRISLRYSPQG